MCLSRRTCIPADCFSTCDLVKVICCMQHQGVRVNTGWLRIRLMCLSRRTCIPADCFNTCDLVRVICCMQHQGVRVNTGSGSD